MRVEYHQATIIDLNDAVTYYESQRNGLGLELRQEIYRSIDRIAESPSLYPKVSGDIQRCFIHRFPFSILYRVVSEDVLRILVIRHHRRSPVFGMKRK